MLTHRLFVPVACVLLAAAAWTAAAPATATSSGPATPAATKATASHTSAPAAPVAAPSDAKPQCYAVLVTGLPGSDLYARRFNDWQVRMQAMLVKQFVPRSNIICLSGDSKFRNDILSGDSTFENVRKAVADTAAKVRPQDQFIFMFAGHGTMADVTPSLLLPGSPDLSAADLADVLSKVQTSNQAVLMMCSSAGDFVKPLARAGRAVVAANRAGDGGEPVFAEFLLRGIESKRADGESLVLHRAPGAEPVSTQPAVPAGSKDGVVTLLEAYNWATHQTALWTMRQKGDSASNAWTVEGRETVETFKKLCVGADGEPGARKLASGNEGMTDEVFPLKVKPGSSMDGWWTGRRLLTEHATLEDCGQPAGASALRETYPGYESLNGVKEGEPGFLARRIVLGSPSLLPAVSTQPAASQP
jgi:hypothetical protein